MLDPKFIRNNIDLIKKTLLNHTKEGVPKDILEQFLNHDIKSRSDISKLQELNTKRNNLTSLFEHTKDNVEKEKLKKEVITFKNQIEELNNICNENDKKMHEILFSIPNILDDSVPIGETEEDNVELRKFGTIRTDKVLPHYEIGVKLNLLDFERGAKISGTRGYILKGNGSKLLRALRDFTLDLAEQNGYVEIQPPMLIKEELLYGLGKIPFFQEDMYATADKTYLPATEEFAITAMHANETLLATNLPLKYTGSCVNYRKEAGSAGKDVRGILRVHYFWNTELIHFTTKEQSWQSLEEMTNQAETVLKELEIPYRVVLLCSGDTGAAAAKTYDIEVHMPASGLYREISSCSNCLEYQSRGLNIKYLDPKTKEKCYVHTLNGTGVSLNRLWIAIVENCQTKDGRIKIPTKLVKYFGKEFIE